MQTLSDANNGLPAIPISSWNLILAGDTDLYTYEIYNPEQEVVFQSLMGWCIDMSG